MQNNVRLLIMRRKTRHRTLCGPVLIAMIAMLAAASGFAESFEKAEAVAKPAADWSAAFVNHEPDRPPW